MLFLPPPQQRHRYRHHRHQQDGSQGPQPFGPGAVCRHAPAPALGLRVQTKRLGGAGSAPDLVQLRNQVLGGLVAIVGVLGKQPKDDALQAARDVRP